MVNENPEKKSTSLNNSSKNMDTLCNDLWVVLTSSENDKSDNIGKEEVSNSENGSDTEGTIENYEENLGILIDQYIQDKELNWGLARAFKKFCEVECGWLGELSIDIVSFMHALRTFNEKIMPKYRKYVKIDEKYLK